MDYVKAVTDLIDWGIIEGPLRVRSLHILSKHNEVSQQFNDISKEYIINLSDDLSAKDARILSHQNTLTYVDNEYYTIMSNIRNATNNGEYKAVLGFNYNIEDLHYLTIKKLEDDGYTVWYTEDKHWVVEW